MVDDEGKFIYMISAFDLKRRLWVYLTLVFLGYVVACLVSRHWPADIEELLRGLPKAVGFGVLVAWAIGRPAVINRLWGCFPVLNQWIAPNINGTYVLKNSSNWPMKLRMLNALNGKPPGKEGDGDQRMDVVGKLVVKMGLFSIQIRYLPSEEIASRSSSEVLSASFQVSKTSSDFELSYIYLATVISPNGSTDEQHYYGSAQLRVPLEREAPNKLAGIYWTNRSWMRGLNTAGEAIATRDA